MEIQNALIAIMSKYLEEGMLQLDMSSLTAKERLGVVSKLLPYYMPKSTCIEVSSPQSERLREYKEHILALARMYDKRKE